MIDTLPRLTLDELPSPNKADGKLVIYLDDEKVRDKILNRLEMLGWIWVFGGEPASEFKPNTPSAIQLGHAFEKGCRALSVVSASYDLVNSLGLTFVRLADGESKKKIINLKAENTKPGIKNCVSCGGKLKNPMPGLTMFQHCPVCEP